MNAVRVLARAKINLHLSVEGLRPDGYHDLTMVMQTVELVDELTMAPAGRTEVEFRFGEGIRGEPPPPPDLVERAVEAYRMGPGGGGGTSSLGARVDVLKRIPLASGLAGGSADAAAALAGMDALDGGRWAAVLPRLAAEVGSDVPFALLGGTCLAAGRGDELQPVACPAQLWWVLGISDSGISTPEAFRRWDVLGPGEPGPLSELLPALADGDPERIGGLLHNDLARAARDVEPRLGAREGAMRAAGVLGCVVSGSGPTVAGLCRDGAHATEVADRVRGDFDHVVVAPSAGRGAEVLPRLDARY